jgi:hypothetical protein
MSAKRADSLSTSGLPEKRKRLLAAGIAVLLPLLMILAALQVKNSSGPYWLSSNLDPTYAYLLNSLNLANGHRPFLTEHPGTPVQFTGALIIRALNGTNRERATAENVIRNVESYISRINIVFIVLSAVLLLLAGYLAFRVTGAIVSAIAVQLTPFVSTTVLTGLLGFRPEAALISISTLFILAILLRLKYGSPKHAGKFSLAFGLIAGLGVASKFTFLPLVLMPFFLLPSWRYRIKFAVASGAAFVLAIAPAIAPHQLKTMTGFVFQTTVHTGRYGGGPAGFISSSNYLQSVAQLIKGDPIFFAVLLIGVVLLVLRTRWLPSDSMRYRALLAISVAEVFQLLLVAKEPTQRYLIPALALTGLNLVLLLDCLRRMFGNRLKQYTALVVLLFVSVAVLQFVKIRRLNENLGAVAQEQLAVYQKVEHEFPGVSVVRYYTASSPMYAFRMGSEYSNNFYGKLLEELYPNNFFYSPWNGRFHNFAVPIELNQIPTSRGWFVMHGLSFKDRDFDVFPKEPFPAGVEVESIFNGDIDRPGVIDGEAIYKATIKSPR